MHVALGVDPAHQIHGALVAGGGALRQQKDVLAEVFAHQHARLAPEVRGDEQAVLHALGGAGEVGDDAGEAVFLVKQIHKLDARVIAALDVGKHRGVGVAPHLRRAVVVAHAAAHAHRRAAKGVDKAALRAVVPGLADALGDAVGQKDH